MKLDQTIMARGNEYPIVGQYDSEFQAVVDAFIENFKVEDEIGAACSIVQNGKTVVDIWGGWCNGEMNNPWVDSTTVCMMSVAKGITAICFNMLMDRGLVNPDAPVIKYWPEYGQNGKEATLIKHFLDHTAAVPVLTTNPLWQGAMFDREAIVHALEEQEPLWEIGTKAAYHVHHQGFLLGEIMRRVTGDTVGPFLKKEVSGPLHAEYYIGGMSEEEQSHVAEVMPNMEAKLFAAKDGADQTSLRALAFKQNPDEPWAVTMNKKEWREVEVASGSGHGNARGVARIYGCVANGELDGVTLLSRDGLETMITEQHNQTEGLQERPYHQAMGVLLNTPEAVYMGPNMRSFGHHGIGGSIGFGDPDAKIGFSYSCNKMHAVGTNGPRAARLIDALYTVG
ncbi:MAG: beta-lactamase family protein [Gammaproteobacteria bacterium]|nr:beta-lactamase family protein [Gammaproteobacteria bacterium]MBT6044277.1 beta-lactamase family protein [Gammaproteobacteria bacterium]